MNACVTLCFLLGVLTFISTSCARIKEKHEPYTFNKEIREDSGFARRLKEYRRTGRKSRHSRQISPPDYPWDIKDFIRRELQTQFQELKLSLDIDKTFLRNPPQIIYIGYPVYICPKGVNHDNIPTPELPPRVFTPVEIDDDGSRPISLKPFISNKPQISPSVEHGSFHYGIFPATTTVAPTTSAPKTTTRPSVKEPGICETAILNCCSFDDNGGKRKECFEKLGCRKTYAMGNACSNSVIGYVLKHFQEAYGPKTPPR